MKSKLHRKNLFIGGCLLLCLIFATCAIVSKTFTIVFYIEEPILSTDQEITWKKVDLTDNKDWQEHHEK